MSETKALEKRKPAELAPGAAISDKLVGRLAQRFGVPATGLLKILRDTFFIPPKKDDRPFSNEEMAAALILCEKYDLNPFAKQIYVTRNRGMLLVIVPIDGWAKIANDNSDYDGCEFDYVDDKDGNPVSCTCRIYRKSRSRPTEVPEYFDECFAPKSDSEFDPWRKWPRRMLRHKAFIQSVRLAFALSEVVDDDEAARYVALDPADYTAATDALPEPEKKPRRRRAPREVMADPVVAKEPPPDNSANQNLDDVPVQHLPPDESYPEDDRSFDVCWENWTAIRRDLDAPTLAKIRKEAGCELVDKSIGLENIRKVLEIAEEMRI